MTKYFIYGLFEPDTNQIRYVGCTTRPALRLTEHRKLRGGSANSNVRLWVKDLRSRGLKPILKILDEPSFEERYESEIFHISYLRFLGCNLLNKTIGGPGVSGLQFTEQTKLKMSLSSKGRPAWNKGKKWSPESLANVTEANRKRARENPVSEETRAKISRLHKGRKHSQEFKDKIKASWIIRKAKKNVTTHKY